MTAPDDLARTLAEHPYMTDFRESQRSVCGCGLVFISALATVRVKAHRAHLAARLASVVSRRDADLRTRIETLLGHCVHNGPCEVMPNGNCDALTDGTLLRSLLARALDADTREDAVNDQFAADLNDALHAGSRVPADTDTGRGQ